VAPQPDRAALTDIALDLFRSRGYDNTTPDQIAAAAGISAQQLARDFATKDAVVMSLCEQILDASVAPLARLAPNADPLDALLVAHGHALTAIVNDIGAVTRDCLATVAEILTAHHEFREPVRALRMQVLSGPLAEYLGAAPDDRRVRRAITMWSAIVAGSFNSFDRAGIDPSGDGRVPELMVQRLKETFTQVMGREPARLAIDPPA
jgi:AcrR family transcriptional regulator